VQSRTDARHVDAPLLVVHTCVNTSNFMQRIFGFGASAVIRDSCVRVFSSNTSVQEQHHRL